MAQCQPSAMSTHMHSDLCTPVYTWEHACAHTHVHACLKTEFDVIPALVCSSHETSGSCLHHPASVCHL